MLSKLQALFRLFSHFLKKFCSCKIAFAFCICCIGDTLRRASSMLNVSCNRGRLFTLSPPKDKSKFYKDKTPLLALQLSSPHIKQNDDSGCDIPGFLQVEQTYSSPK